MANPLPKHQEQDPTHDLGLYGERLEAATAIDRNVLTLAGPGAGKTTLLVAHAVYLARTQTGNIVVLTFSRNAARELHERIAARLSDHERRSVSVSTIHSYALRILDAYGYRLGLGRPLEILETTRDIEAMAEKAAAEYGERAPYGFAERLAKVLRRGLLSAPDRAGETLMGKVLLEMRRCGRLSWESCVHLAEELLQDSAVRSSLQHHDRFVLLDEAQDCDSAQLSFLRHLVGENHLFVAMDPDQSLYAFRDADPTRAHRWAQSFEPREFQLTENYRCPPRVVALAQAILGKPSEPVPSHEAGTTCFFYGSKREKEAQFVADEVVKRLENGFAKTDIAVLCRQNKPLDLVANELEARGIKTRRKLQWEFTPSELRLISTLQLLHDLEEGEALSPLARKALSDELGLNEEAIQSLESRAVHGEIVGPVDLVDDGPWGQIAHAREQHRHPSQLLSEIAAALGLQDLEDGPLMQIAQEARTLSLLLRRCRKVNLSAITSMDEVLVTTFHGSKGLEFKSVFVMACEDGIIPDFRSRQEQDLVHERRTLYVATTRTSSEVVFTAARKDQNREQQPCPFLPLARRDLWTRTPGWPPAKLLSKP